MTKRLLTIAMLVLASVLPVQAQSTLEARRIYLGTTGTTVTFFAGAVDPSAGAGVVAPLGSQYWSTTGEVWLKTGAADTAWTRTASSAPPVTGSGTATYLAGWSSTYVLAASGLIYSGANITTGVWQATPVVTTYGGTGLASWTVGDIPYYAAGTALSKLALGTTGYWLGSGVSAPQWNAYAALSKTDDTNVTLTLGGTPSTALLNAASLTLGWTGTLAVARGGTARASWTQYGVVFAGTTDSLDQDADLTFNADTLSATKVASSSLTSGRVPYATTAGLLVDDADLLFAVDTLTATKALMPTYGATPYLYAYGAAKSLTLGGTGVSGCSIADPAVGGTADCEAESYTLTSAFLEQRLTTNTAVRSQWYVQDTQDTVPPFANFTAYNNNGWMGMRFFGAPVTIAGGGFHVGQNAVADPGLGNTYHDGWVRSTSPVYASQTTGMAVDFTDGSIDARYLFVDEMHAKKFIADLEQALAGGQIISKSVGMIGADFTVPAKGSISVLTMKDLPSAEGMAIFESGDIVRIRTFSRAAGSLSIADAWGTVTSYTDLADKLQSWNFQRILGDDGGAMAADTVIPVDSIALDYGVSGNGFHEVNAIDGLYGVNSPYSQIVTWSGSSPRSANQTVRTRMGNLKGITGSLEYGLLAGTYGSTSSGQYIIFSDTRAEIHNVPLSLYSGSNQTLHLDPVLSAFKQAAANASTLTYTSGTGCWSGIDAGVFKWRCGDMGGQYIAWNGTTLNVNGNITVTGLIAADTLAVDGVAAATVASGASRAMTGLTAAGNPSLPALSAPSGAGLFLGSDYMGYYTGGVWTSFIKSDGTWRFNGNATNYVSWNGTTLDVKGSITITGGSGYANLTDKPTLGTISALNEVALGTNTSGGYAGSASEGGNAADTVLVDGTAAATVKGGAIIANLGLDASGNVKLPVYGGNITGANGVAGLNLTSTYLGYCSTATCVAGAGWTSFLDSSGNFYLGGTSGALQWVAGTGTLTISATLSGNGSGITSIAGGNITTDSITATQIAANTITATQIAAGTITGDKLFAGTITATQIAAGTITATEIAAMDLSAISASLGTITSGSIIVVNGANTVGLTPSGANAIYAGPTGAPAFTVTPAGALIATSATITGAITATSGSFTGTVNATAGYFGSGATRVAIEAAGLNVGNTGSIRGGQTAYDTGTGFFLGYSGGAYKLSIGAAAGNKMTWDGGKLTIKGLLVSDYVTFSNTGTFGLDWSSFRVNLAYWTGSSAGTFSGLTNSVDGVQLTIFNRSGSSATLTIQHGTSASDFNCPGGSDIVLNRNGSVLVMYDGAAGQWFVLSYNVG